MLDTITILVSLWIIVFHSVLILFMWILIFFSVHGPRLDFMSKEYKYYCVLYPVTISFLSE